MKAAFWLTHQDSNLERQNQNLLCYHYTMGQSIKNQYSSSLKKKSSLLG